MKQSYVLICESAIVEKGTNNLYVLGIFENIYATKVPARHPKFAVVTHYENGTGEHEHKIVIRHESGLEILQLEGRISFGSKKKSQYIGRFTGITFPKFGKYTIESYIDGVQQPHTQTADIEVMEPSSS